MKMKNDLLELSSHMLYTEIPFDIIKEKSFVRILTDSFELRFKNNGEILSCSKLDKPRIIGELVLD